MARHLRPSYNRLQAKPSSGGGAAGKLGMLANGLLAEATLVMLAVAAFSVLYFACYYK